MGAVLAKKQGPARMSTLGRFLARAAPITTLGRSAGEGVNRLGLQSQHLPTTKLLPFCHFSSCTAYIAAITVAPLPASVPSFMPASTSEGGSHSTSISSSSSCGSLDWRVSLARNR